MTPKRWLALLLAAHLALGVVFAWATPIFEAPDEGTHAAFVHALATGQGLPVQDPANPGPWQQEGSQPPLYYVLASVLARTVDMSDFEARLVEYPLTKMGVPGTSHGVNRYRHPLEPQAPVGTALAVYLVRGFSLVLSLGTIALTYALGLALYPDRPWLAVLGASLVALNPMALFINASVNNDNLLMLLSTAALLLCMRVMHRGESRGERLALGVVLGLAALTKVSGLVVWPVAALALMAPAWRRSRLPNAGSREDLGSLVFWLVVVFGAALAVCGWWYWRNWVLYGEWLGLNTMVAIAQPREPQIGLLALIANEWRGFVLSYWAVFGVFTIVPPRWVVALYDGLMLAALAGGVIAALQARGRARPVVWLLGLFCLLTLAGVARWTLQTPASQGRLMFGAIAPLSLFLARGLWETGEAVQTVGRRWRLPRLATVRKGGGQGKGQSAVMAATVGLALMAGIIPIAYIAPRYKPPPIIAEAELPADLRPVHALFSGAIELVGYRAAERGVRPGEPVEVTLFWRALKTVDRDYSLALHLLGRQVTQVGTLDTWPGGGLAPTSQWSPGQIIADTYSIELEQTAAVPTRLRLDLYFWDEDPFVALPRTTLDGTPLPSVTLNVGRALPAETVEAEPEQPLQAEFEHGLTLLGYDVSADGALYLTLYWGLETGSRVPRDYSVFMHMVDGQGVLVMEPADSPPLDGDWPTSLWEPGQVVADTRLVALPPNLHAGRYDLRLGFYDPATGERLEARQPDGQRWPADAVVLEDLIVK